MDWTLSKHHKKRYGGWAGRPNGCPADPDQCAEEVWRDHFWGQCSRKRGHGPDGAFCKQHSPEAKKARAEKQRAEYEATRRKARERNAQRQLEIDALSLVKEIAVGHNDPRGAAIALLERFNQTETPAA